MIPLFDRFLNKISVDENDCWRWIGAIDGKGYGRILINNKNCLAHRLAFEMLKTSIPKGLYIDHLCRVRSCVNPDHMECVTPRINCYRGFAPSAINRKKTHCKHGHEFTPENTYKCLNKFGKFRQCKKCRFMTYCNKTEILKQKKEYYLETNETRNEIRESASL